MNNTAFETPRETNAHGKARQLIVLNDGTNNNITGGTSDTNVVKLCELLRAHAHAHTSADTDPHGEQVVFYDPGVGNPEELPGATRWEQKVRRLPARLRGLAFGSGVFDNIAQAYLFLMRNYRPAAPGRAADQIFIFGFSRGAFTARSLAGVIKQFGILQPHLESMVNTLLHIYFSQRGDAQDTRWPRTAAQAQRLFAAPAAQQVDIQFIGVWDTVASVGMPPFGLRFTTAPTVQGKCFLHVRQALALDEHRAQFKHRLYADDNGPITTGSGRQGSLVQLWFRGGHCNVGGGYAPEQAELSDRPMAWLLSEAVLVGGLRLGALKSEDDFRAAALQLRTPPANEPALPSPPMQRAHSELHDSCWWALTGMAQRETTFVALDQGAPIAVKPQEHPSVQEWEKSPHKRWSWLEARPWAEQWPLLLCSALALGLMLVMGWLLHAPSGAAAGTAIDLSRLDGATLLGWLNNNAAYTVWQLQAVNPFAGDAALRLQALAFHAPRWVLLWDLLFIVAYTYVLARAATWAFYRRTGLRRAGQATNRWLNRLGFALPLLVGADLAENLFSLLTITLAREDVPFIATVSGMAMALACLAKWVGLAGVLALVGSGLLPRKK